MTELRAYFKASIEKKLVPFLKNYGFNYYLTIHEFSDTHDVFIFKKDIFTYIEIYHYGFNPHDAPWSFNPLLGKEGFRKTLKQFDYISLGYVKQKIAPVYPYQQEAIKLNFDHYVINSIEEINNSIKQTIFDLDNFCKDFLMNDFLRFDRIREIKYLEYLVQTQVVTETNWLGSKRDVMKQNDEIE